MKSGDMNSNKLAFVLSCLLALAYASPVNNHSSRESLNGTEDAPKKVQYVNVGNKTVVTEFSEQHLETCPGPMEEFVSPVRGSPRCCRMCGPGTGMLRLCTDADDTQCIGCEPGVEFSPTTSATLKCQQCRRCQDIHPLATTRIVCTPTTDTECGCMKGYYMSVNNQTCKACTVCKPNEGVIRPCEWNADTQCQACPAGFWSASVGDTVKCIPCKTCAENEVMVRNCRENEDALCCPKTNVNCTLSPVFGFDYTRYEQNGEASDTSSKQNQMLPIYCSIMGFIIVFLLLYVVYKLWKQREAMTNAKLCEVYTSSGYSTVKLPVNSAQMDSVLNGPCDGDGGGAADHVKSENISRLTTKHLCGANRQQERDPLIANFETGANELSYLEIQLVTLQRDVLGMICFQLSRSGWREMATNMDIPTTSLLGPSANDSEFATQLAQAAQEAKHLILKESTTQNSPDEDTIKASARLLAKLCQQPTANVRVLLTELERINRGDIVAFISDKLTSSPAIPISPWSATKDPRV
ncbi:hypothetical protein CRM22_004569 [Opisthorchis felineus]|uniref:TNFR-Cys domain-containing protein n=1 Tax=Opisthorchis felineus TaxID=147828 RepID=A0A4S2LVI2_OPIFE|nr:hypothetical protein CRM22_004569 [Opisthorchis felineus]